MKVLVVDDDSLSLRVAVSILEKNSFEVEAMSCVRDALDFLEKCEYVDVIVSDIMMPNIDGFSFVRHMKTDKRLSKIPVILCTSLNDKASLVKAIEAGVHGYIVKPVKADVLVAKVKKAVESNPGAILVVDDEELIRNLLVATLKRDGYKVLVAGFGEEAIELVKTNKVGLVISDIAMPEMDGFELLAHLKEEDMSIPVILMSGRSEYSRDDIIAVGANDFIAKPFRNTEILTRVRTHHKRKR